MSLHIIYNSVNQNVSVTNSTIMLNLHLLFGDLTSNALFIKFITSPFVALLSLKVKSQKSVLYICVSFSVLHIGLSLPSF